MFFAKIQRHTSQNAISEGDLREQQVKVKIGPPDQLMICNAKKATARITEFFLLRPFLFAKQLFYAREGTL